ncbi:MFS transporter [Streptomyces sp. NPDC055085]
MTHARTVLFATAAGAAVANLYWCQPLLNSIAHDLAVRTSAAGWLVTAGQIGYAVGIIFLVPLGDLLNRRQLIPLTLLGASAGLVFCAVAPTLGLLLVASIGLGLATVAGQILTPLAGDLSSPARRGHIVSTVVSGILLGILVSRVIAGLVADIAGWRAVFLMAAASDALLAFFLYRAIPALSPKTDLAYPALLASVWHVVRGDPVVRWILTLNVPGFALFSMFWTSLTFLLSSSPFSFPPSTIGLFGLAGIVGVVAVRRAGRLYDRGWSLPAVGIAWAVTLTGFAVALFSSRSVVLVVISAVLVDSAVQALSVLNQAHLFALSQHARSRLNTAFVAANFLGGLLGSAAASVLWGLGGWDAIAYTGIAVSCGALLVWLIGRRLGFSPPTDRALTAL